MLSSTRHVGAHLNYDQLAQIGERFVHEHADHAADVEIAEGRDWGGIFVDIVQLRATETALSRVCGGKATEG